MRFALLPAFAGAGFAAGDRALVGRVGSTGFVPLEAERFKQLSLWHKRLLDGVASHTGAAHPKMMAFTRLFRSIYGVQ